MHVFEEGSVTMVGFGMAPTEGWEVQTIQQRVAYLDEIGMPLDDNQRASLLGGKTGLAEFRVTTQSEADLAIIATKAAIEDAYTRCPGFDEKQIGAFFTGGGSLSRAYPSSACHAQDASEVPGGAALAASVRSASKTYSACASFGQVLHSVNAMMRYYRIPYTVLSFAEPIFSRVANVGGPEDVHWCLWGDGAGAVVLRYDPKGSPDEGLVFSDSLSYGEKANLTCSRGMGTDATPDEPWNPSMEGLAPEIQRFIREHMPPFVRQCLERSGLERELDYYVPHAANRYAGRKIGRELGVVEENVLSEIERYGNTSSASCLLTLYHAVQEGRFAPGSLMAINPFGGGMVATCGLYVWPG